MIKTLLLACGILLSTACNSQKLGKTYTSDSVWVSRDGINLLPANQRTNLKFYKHGDSSLLDIMSRDKITTFYGGRTVSTLVDTTSERILRIISGVKLPSEPVLVLLTYNIDGELVMAGIGFDNRVVIFKINQDEAKMHGE